MYLLVGIDVNHFSYYSYFLLTYTMLEQFSSQSMINIPILTLESLDLTLSLYHLAKLTVFFLYVEKVRLRGKCHINL